MLKSFINEKWILLLSITYVLPLIIANVYYTDDMGRAIFGYGWDSDGRIFASALMKMLSFNETITSFFPISLILSAIVMALAGRIVSNILFDHDSLWKKLSSLILLTSPFYLENLSYRYDSLPMSLSVLLSITPYIFWDKNKFFISSVICLTLIFGLYQTSAMAYFSMFICLLLRDFFDKRTINYKLIALGLAAFILSYFIYTLTINHLHINLDRAGFLPVEKEILRTLVNRWNIYISVYCNLLNSGYITALTPLISLFVVSLAIITIKGKSSGLLSLLVVIISIIGLYTLTMLPNLVLLNPWFNARTFICFPFILYGVVFVCSRATLPWSDTLISTAIVFIIVYSFIISSVFGAVLNVNNEYDNFLSSSLSSSMIKDNNYKVYKVVISGRANTPLKSELQYKSYPILKNLAPIYTTENWYWGVRNLSRYIPMQSLSDNRSIINDMCNYEIISDTSLYILRAKENTFIIDFKKNKC